MKTTHILPAILLSVVSLGLSTTAVYAADFVTNSVHTAGNVVKGVANGAASLVTGTVDVVANTATGTTRTVMTAGNHH